MCFAAARLFLELCDSGRGVQSIGHDGRRIFVYAKTRKQATELQRHLDKEYEGFPLVIQGVGTIKPANQIRRRGTS